MSEQKIVTLDLTGCKSYWELHERIRITFGFPEWYGKNWSAFWDLLSNDCDADKVEVMGEHTLSKEFAPDIEKIHEILQRNKEECERFGWSCDYEIIN
ncbi:barstar family protein [Clostridium minihomine]|uniref:barstar family protein n=1 Tax=Clostridium minihomine TaxID=2045012 RepID=UPI000C77ADE5|nr:barstar family protein [Clostridium minihomine]